MDPCYDSVCYSTLAIWVGSTILVALVKVKASPKGLGKCTELSIVFRQIFAVLLIGTDSGSHHCSRRSVAVKSKHCGTGAVFSWRQALRLNGIFPVDLFSDTGIRRCGQGRLRYCYGIADRWFQRYLPDRTATGHLPEDLYFLSLPYAIRAMREALAGMYGTAYMEALAKLSLFMIEGLLIGLVIRIPFVKLNHFVERAYGRH